MMGKSLLSGIVFAHLKIIKRFKFFTHEKYEKYEIKPTLLNLFSFFRVFRGQIFFVLKLLQFLDRSVMRFIRLYSRNCQKQRLKFNNYERHNESRSFVGFTWQSYFNQ